MRTSERDEFRLLGLRVRAHQRIDEAMPEMDQLLRDLRRPTLVRQIIEAIPVLGWGVAQRLLEDVK